MLSFFRHVKNATRSSYLFPAWKKIATPVYTLHGGIHKKIKRCRLPFFSNYSAALRLPMSFDTLLDQIQHPMELLHSSHDLILEHAARRIDLFFYTAIAYYRTGVIPDEGHTRLQHGSGRGTKNTSFTQGCHSSFTPAFFDNIRRNNPPIFFVENFLLGGTHFMDSLNATIELPRFVNEFDDVLEKKYHCRQKCLQLLKQVSLNELNPLDALLDFFKMMQTVFDEIKHDLDTTSSTSTLKKYLLQLVKQGSFINKFNLDSQKIEKAYIDLLLRLTPLEKSVPPTKAFYEKKFLEMQREIVSREKLKLADELQHAHLSTYYFH